ncbi:MAG: hypothetical protein ACXQS6_03410 [Candidatus Syntropharchaeales archaeon]
MRFERERQQLIDMGVWGEKEERSWKRIESGILISAIGYLVGVIACLTLVAYEITTGELLGEPYRFMLFCIALGGVLIAMIGSICA